MKARRIGVLLSGGLDSAALVAYYLTQDIQVFPIYVRAGLPWEPSELACAGRFLDTVRHTCRPKPLLIATLDLETAYDANWSRTGNVPDARSADSLMFLPGRNLLLLTKALLALSNEGVHDLAIGILRGNRFLDASLPYFKKLQDVLSIGFGHPCRIHAPFRGKTKVGIIRSFRSFPLHLSVSCVQPVGAVHCGKCNKCEERRRAFSEAGVRDRTVYTDVRWNLG